MGAPRKLVVLTVATAVLAVLPACGPVPRGRSAAAAAPSVPVAQFPERARITARLELGPPPDLASHIPRGYHHVQRWEMTSAPVVGDPVYEPEGVFEPLLDAAATERGVSFTRSASLKCVAQETARFFLEHEAWPTLRLSRFLLGACGSSAITVGQAGTSGTIDPRATEAQLVEHAGPSLTAAIAPGLVDHGSVGLGFARQGSRVALVVVVAQPMAELAPPEPPGADGLAIVRGRLLLEGGDAVVAHVNQGAYGVAACRVTPGFALPELELRCPVAEGDETALVQIRTVTVGRVLTRHVASVLLRRSPEARPVFDASPLGGATPVSDPAQASALLLERLNAVRASQGLRPLVLSAAQSEVHQQVAPYLLASLDQPDGDEQHVLSLGLLAGWEITGGTIRWGDIVAELTLGGSDASEWIGNALEQPAGRFVLMRPQARAVAIGAVPVADPSALGVVVSTYAFFEDVDHAADADRYFDRITAARSARGLPPPRRLAGLSRLTAHAAAVSAARESPTAAFQAGLNEEGAAQRRSVRGLALEALDLDWSPLPEELFTQRELTLGVVVAHTRAPGAAWGQYVVFLVIG